MIRFLITLTLLLVATGVALVVLGLRGTTKPLGPPSRTGARLLAALTGAGQPTAEKRLRRILLTVSVVTVVAVWAATGILILALLAAAAIPTTRWLWSIGAAERRAIDRVDAIAEWTRRLRDITSTGVGLQQAVVKSRDVAPPAIRGEVASLAAQLTSGRDPRSALRSFAGELADAQADQVVAALTLHLTDHGERLGAALNAISEGASAEAATRRETDAERQGARTTVRWLAGMTVGVIALMIFTPGWMAPYKTPLGQIVMAGLGLLLAAILWMVQSLTRPPVIPRLLTTSEADQ
ncbi:type II secretion system F family protein [Phytomonospora sp. NPDC050363]|uniref:type II secretion system F family protein n=1 Tax=Phytomonospora sp. NPDC050363 TaxID=3155642 RepID=UPI0033E83892